MTKIDITEILQSQLSDLTRREAAGLVDAVFAEMKHAFCEKGILKISGFGVFEVKDKSERVGRNPQTGKPMTISARRVLTFNPSKVLREQINRD